MRVRIDEARNYYSVIIAHHRRVRIFAPQLRKRSHARNSLARNGDRAAGDVALRPHGKNMARADQRDGLAHSVSFAYRVHEMARFSTQPTRKNKIIPMTVRTVTVANSPAVSPR